MRNLLFVILALLIVAGVYGYGKNPQACGKLADDLKVDLTAIFVPGTALTTATTNTTTEVAAALTPSPATTTLAPPASAPAPSPVPSPLPPPAPAPAPQVPGAPERVDEFTDYDAGLSAAKASNKLVLIDFTGSDWCPYCQKLDQEVLATSDFTQFAGPNFVIVTIDFPRQKPLDDHTSAANDALKSKFNVQGFPTLVLLNGSEKELGRMTGYDPGSGPAKVIAELQSFAASR